MCSKVFYRRYLEEAGVVVNSGLGVRTWASASYVDADKLTLVCVLLLVFCSLVINLAMDIYDAFKFQI